MRFRKFDPRFWRDEKVREFDITDKLITAYIITAQSNRIGIFNFSPGQASEDLGLPVQTFLKRFRDVIRSLNYTFDEGARVLYIPTWWKYNAPENENVLKGNLRDLDDLPKTPLIARFSTNLEYLPETFHETFRERCLKRLPNQEQEQKQEQERESVRSQARSKKSKPHFEIWFEEQFKPAYPRPVQAATALAALRRINPGADTCTGIMARLDRWKTSDEWTKEGAKFVPGMGKFFLDAYHERDPGTHSLNGRTPSPILSVDEIYGAAK